MSQFIHLQKNMRVIVAENAWNSFKINVSKKYTNKKYTYQELYDTMRYLEINNTILSRVKIRNSHICSYTYKHYSFHI